MRILRVIGKFIAWIILMFWQGFTGTKYRGGAPVEPPRYLLDHWSDGAQEYVDELFPGALKFIDEATLSNLRESGIVTRTIGEIRQAAHDTRTPQVMPLCNIVFADPSGPRAKKIIEVLSSRVTVVHTEDMTEDVTGPYVVIGPRVYRGIKWNFSCSQMYAPISLVDAVLEGPQDIPVEIRLLRCDYASKVDRGTLTIGNIPDFVFDVLLPQWELRRDFPGVTHVIGPSGSGKTTLISSMKCRAVDLDTLYDELPGGLSPWESNQWYYRKLRGYLEDGVRVFVGIPVDITVLAEHKWLLDVPPETSYRRQTARTIESICQHKDELIGSLMSTDNLPGTYDELSKQYAIRNCGWVSPSQEINWALDLVDRWIHQGYTPASPGQILSAVGEKNTGDSTGTRE